MTGTAKARRENETDQRLRLLVGLVVVAAAIALAGVIAASVMTHSAPPYEVEQVKATLFVAFLVGVGFAVRIRTRIRAATHSIAWAETAIVIAIAVATVQAVVIGTAIGVYVALLFRRTTPLKIAFAIAKNVLLATVAGGAFIALHPQTSIARPTALVAPLAAAYFSAVILDEILALPVIALATRTNLAKLFRDGWDLRLMVAVARFGFIVCTLLVVRLDSQLLIAIPPTALCLHLFYSSRLRHRSERQAWQSLAYAIDALNLIEIDKVLASAIRCAGELFSADGVEVEIHELNRLTRGGAGTVSYDGPAGGAPASDISSIAMALQGPNGSDDIGVVRLLFRGPVTLSEREQYTFKTFASALGTAIRNASAYAELARAAEEHAHAASHDALTGLPNRRHLLEVGNEQLRGQRAEGVVALLLIDLNHFKEVNDTLGHAAGDRVLVQVADRLRAAVRGDDLVARLGGDEFAVLFRGLPAPAVAAHRTESLLAALHQPLDLDGMRISVEASGGIAHATNTGGMAELLRRADVAMYQAKRSGRKLSTYLPAQDTADLGRLILGGDLPRAVADDEFTVTFQPIVELSSGEVVAAEALARWQHPVHGLMDPLRFLDAVERSGLLPAFAEAVLDQSLIAARAWREAGFDLSVAVNVSPRSLLDARFPSAVLARLQAHDLPPERLILELTETLALSQLEVVDQVLNQLRKEGVRLALDDFGTGYSSLSMLSRIPVHELKIDREFVMSMETSAEAAAVIRSTVDLGRSLDLMVVAEGVESEPQRLALWELGCVAGQGHLFARPMAASRLLSALQHGADGRPGTLAPPLHEAGSVVRLPAARRTTGRRTDRLPHLPA